MGQTVLVDVTNEGTTADGHVKNLGPIGLLPFSFDVHRKFEAEGDASAFELPRLGRNGDHIRKGQLGGWCAVDLHHLDKSAVYFDEVAKGLHEDFDDLTRLQGMHLLFRVQRGDQKRFTLPHIAIQTDKKGVGTHTRWLNENVQQGVFLYGKHQNFHDAARFPDMSLGLYVYHECVP